MSVLSDKKTVVGLFGQDHEVDHVVRGLQDRGFGRDEGSIEILDQHRLGQEAPIDAPGLARPKFEAAGGEHVLPVFEPVTEAGIETPLLRQTVFDMLNEVGLDDEEADFFAQQVERGAKLILVETGKASVSDVLAIMEKVDGRTVVA